jgi:hypothetical protein
VNAGPAPRVEPAPGSIVATTLDGGRWWVNAGDGTWRELRTDDRPPRSTTWPELDAGGHGAVDLLVPVAYRTPAPDEPAHGAAQHVAEAILNPIGTMLTQLAQAAGAGVTAVVAGAYEQGRRDGMSEAARYVGGPGLLGAAQRAGAVTVNLGPPPPSTPPITPAMLDKRARRERQGRG